MMPWRMDIVFMPDRDGMPTMLIIEGGATRRDDEDASGTRLLAAGRLASIDCGPEGGATDVRAVAGCIDDGVSEADCAENVGRGGWEGS